MRVSTDCDCTITSWRDTAPERRVMLGDQRRHELGDERGGAGEARVEHGQAHVGDRAVVGRERQAPRRGRGPGAGCRPGRAARPTCGGRRSRSGSARPRGSGSRRRPRPGAASASASQRPRRSSIDAGAQRAARRDAALARDSASCRSGRASDHVDGLVQHQPTTHHLPLTTRRRGVRVARSARAAQRAAARQHRVEHRRGEPPGERVLLGHVERADQREPLDRGLSAPWPNFGLGADRRPARAAAQRRVPADRARGTAARARCVSSASSASMPRRAVGALGRQRLVLRRRALHRRGDEAVRQPQAVAAVHRRRLVGVAGAVQRGVQEVPRAVAGEHAAGAVGAVRGGGEADDHEPRAAGRRSPARAAPSTPRRRTPRASRGRPARATRPAAGSAGTRRPRARCARQASRRGRRRRGSRAASAATHAVERVGQRARLALDVPERVDQDRRRRAAAGVSDSSRSAIRPPRTRRHAPHARRARPNSRSPSAPANARAQVAGEHQQRGPHRPLAGALDVHRADQRGDHRADREHGGQRRGRRPTSSAPRGGPACATVAQPARPAGDDAEHEPVELDQHRDPGHAPPARRASKTRAAPARGRRAASATAAGASLARASVAAPARRPAPGSS